MRTAVKSSFLSEPIDEGDFIIMDFDDFVRANYPSIS